jgi:hypothetical protein
MWASVVRGKFAMGEILIASTPFCTELKQQSRYHAKSLTLTVKLLG